MAAAIALGISDVLAKLILAAEGGVLTTLAFRSVVGLAFVTTWLYVGRRPRADATSICASNVSATAGYSAAGSACAIDPPSVPRFRIWK